MNWPVDFIDRIICGDCIDIMKQMPDESINMCLTSPPYWGLRDYGVEQTFGGNKDCEHEWDNQRGNKNIGRDDKYYGGDVGASVWAEKQKKPIDTNSCSKCQAWKGQLGLEPTPELYIEHMTAVFSEVKRILKKEGTLWLNIGDTYSGSNTGHTGPAQTKWKTVPRGNGKSLQSNIDLKPKCLCMIPERLAWSLIQDGWILRNKNIWYKPNGMPSSVKDRFGNKWEYVFMFSKSQKYYFDLDAVREAHADDNIGIRPSKRGINPKYQNLGPEFGAKQLAIQNFNPLGKNPGDVFFIKDRKKSGRKYENISGQTPQSIARHSGYYDENGECLVDFEKGKNPGDVFKIPTQPFPEAHFAVFPEKLCEKPIKAGCPDQVCKKCGKARERIADKQYFGGRKDPNKDNYKKANTGYEVRTEKGVGGTKSNRAKIFSKTIGWTDCGCNAGFKGGTIIDPFCGAGTTLLVAKNLKRHYIGIDIKKEFCKMSEKRTSQGVL